MKALQGVIMRKADVYVKDILAGILEEIPNGKYKFTYLRVTLGHRCPLLCQQSKKNIFSISFLLSLTVFCQKVLSLKLSFGSGKLIEMITFSNL
jgi:hypothetical protein